MNKDEFAAQTPFPIGQANYDYASISPDKAICSRCRSSKLIFLTSRSSRVAAIIGIFTMQRAAADRF